MGILDSVLKIFVGDKSKQDIGEIQPIIDKIKTFESAIGQLNLNELRAKSDEFRNRIKEDQKEVQQQIDDLEKKSETEEDINVKEEIYNEIDQLKDDRYAIEKKTLDDILPEAFSVMKETAKRFTNNKTLTVTASPFDREISAIKNYVTLEGT